MAVNYYSAKQAPVTTPALPAVEMTEFVSDENKNQASVLMHLSQSLEATVSAGNQNRDGNGADVESGDQNTLDTYQTVRV